MKAVDLFAGWGGMSEGARQAGVEVVWAANHWPLAVEVHAANHPTTAHACQDLRQADWTQLPKFDLLLAAPACQGHSEASQPKRRQYHDAMRATAWAVVDCADATNPRAVLVENVPQFREWRLYPDWLSAMRRMGYHVSERVVLASHHGVPQRRPRLFIWATRRPVLRMARDATEPAFGPCIDWSAPGWRPVSDGMPGTQRRIAKGRRNWGDRFLSQHVTGHPGVPLHEPIRTITTKEMWVLVDGDRYRPLTLREYARAMAFPESYRWPDELSRADVIKGLGNAVCPPVARDEILAIQEAA